jgi:hypothetical protein
MLCPGHVHWATQPWQPSQEEAVPRGYSMHWLLAAGGAQSCSHRSKVLALLHVHCEVQSVQDTQLVLASQASAGLGVGSGSAPPEALHRVVHAAYAPPPHAQALKQLLQPAQSSSSLHAEEGASSVAHSR